MKTKVTLTVEKSVVKRSKAYAESTGSSLSNLVENYLKSFSKGPFKHKNNELSPLLKLLKVLKGFFRHLTDLIIKKNCKHNFQRNIEYSGKKFQ